MLILSSRALRLRPDLLRRSDTGLIAQYRTYLRGFTRRSLLNRAKSVSVEYKT
jgi:hypothetical protein